MKRYFATCFSGIPQSCLVWLMLSISDSQKNCVPTNDHQNLMSSLSQRANITFPTAALVAYNLQLFILGFPHRVRGLISLIHWCTCFHDSTNRSSSIFFDSPSLVKPQDSPPLVVEVSRFSKPLRLLKTYQGWFALWRGFPFFLFGIFGWGPQKRVRSFEKTGETFFVFL